MLASLQIPRRIALEVFCCFQLVFPLLLAIVVINQKEQTKLQLDSGWNNIDEASFFRRKLFFELGGAKKLLAATSIHLVKEGIYLVQ